MTVRVGDDDAGPRERARHVVARDEEIELVVDAVERNGRALVTGEAGVGKSSLLRACCAVLEARGFRCFDAAATEGLSDHPLATIGHLLGDRVGDLTEVPPAELTHRAVHALRQLAPGSSAVLVLDDVHHIDRWSIHAALQAARAPDGPHLLVAGRSDAVSDAAIQVGRAPGRRIELQRLSRGETAELAVQVLGAPLDTPSAQRLFAATDGLPLAITELLDHARRSGAIVMRSGLWRWDPTATGDAHLAELIGLRVEQLGDAERDVIDLLSVVERLPIAVVGSFAPGIDLVELEARRLVAAASRAGWVAPAHPMLRDICLARLAPLRRHVLLDRLVTCLDAARAAPRSDPELARLRVLAAVEIDAPVPPDELIAVADYGRAHNLWQPMRAVMRRAWQDLPGPSTGLAYGETLYWCRDMEAAADVLAEALDLATTDAERVRIAVARARTLHVGLGQRDAAERTRRSALEATDDPALRLEVAAAEADELLFGGHIGAIVDLWASSPPLVTGPPSASDADAPADADAGPGPDDDLAAARYRLTQSTIGALGLAGRMADMAHEYADHLIAVERFGMRHPLAAVAAGPWWVSNNELGGCGDRVSEFLAERYAASVALDDGLTRPIWALPVAIERWMVGDLVAAERFAREAMGVPASVVSIRKLSNRFLTRILQLRGRHEEVLAMCDDAAAERDDYVGIVRGWNEALVAISRAAIDPSTALGQRRTEAARRAVGAAEEIIGRGMLLSASYVLHDVTRYGAAAEALPALEHIAGLTDAPAIEWMLAHTRGVVEHDAAALVETANRALSGGHVTLAMHVVADARPLALDRRDAIALAGVTTLSEELAARCTGWPAAVSGPTSTLGLSDRELEVARAAAAGLSDREIAESLVVSVRTVNAHLRAVYRKLGVGRRTDLAGVLPNVERVSAGRQ